MVRKWSKSSLRAVRGGTIVVARFCVAANHVPSLARSSISRRDSRLLGREGQIEGEIVARPFHAFRSFRFEIFPVPVRGLTRSISLARRACSLIIADTKIRTKHPDTLRASDRADSGISRYETGISRDDR